MIIKNPLIIKKAKLQAKTATPTTSSQTIVADSGYDGLSEVQVDAVTSAIDSNITAGNIKKDVTILGVTGTLESGGGTSKLPQVVDRSVTEITADDLSGITAIGGYAFQGCQYLTSIIIPSSVTRIELVAFQNCFKLKSINLPESLTYVGEAAFRNCNGLTSIIIPDNVGTIVGEAFNRCSGLTSVTIGNSVTAIGSNAFANCTSLKSVYIKDLANWCSIKLSNSNSNPLYIAKNLYLNKILATELTIPSSVTSINNYVFQNCTSLTSITIPENVTSIGTQAFYGCSSLTEMTIKATTPPTLSGTSAISTATTTIYIPAGTLEAYQTATNWSSFASKFVELSE